MRARGGKKTDKRGGYSSVDGYMPHCFFLFFFGGIYSSKFFKFFKDHIFLEARFVQFGSAAALELKRLQPRRPGSGTLICTLPVSGQE